MQSVTQRLSRSTPRSLHQRPSRLAFSMIELMVVITIIAILVSLLLVGVQSAMNAARTATVVVELQQLEKGIADFKAKFGTEPPSGIILFEAAAGWAGSAPSAALVGRSRAAVRQIWPDFDFTLARDINDDGDSTDTITLNGAECLVFFLGGVPDQTGVTDNPWAPLGFSTNPLNPFARGGTRHGPFHTFDVGRLRNLEGMTTTLDPEFMPEFTDQIPGQRNPILYASSYGGKGYRDADIQLTTQATYDAYATVPTGFAYYYRRYTGAYPAVVADFTAAPAFNPKSCQLISPGVDGEYGWGGVLNTGMSLAEPRPERVQERDNITNFKGGKIN